MLSRRERKDGPEIFELKVFFPVGYDYPGIYPGWDESEGGVSVNTKIQKPGQLQNNPNQTVLDF